jgi:DNA polymerase (family 10)
MMRLQGVGPKTVAMLYRELGVQTLDDLQQAALDGRVRAIKGMGAKKEALILKGHRGAQKQRRPSSDLGRS